MAEANRTKYQPSGSNNYRSIRAGSKLSRPEANDLKLKLKRAPDDVASRLLLLGFYGGGTGRRVNRVMYHRHMDWFIENDPRNFLLSLPNTYLGADDPLNEETRRKWLRQVRLNPSDVTVLYHAALFCKLAYPDDSIKFLKLAKQINPSYEDFSLQLAFVYRLNATRFSSRKNKSFVVKAVDELKNAVELYAKPSREDSYLLPYFEMVLSEFAELAFEFQLLDKASELGEILLARETLDSSRLSVEIIDAAKNGEIGYRRSKNLGHSILGRVALADGNLEGAKAQLEAMLDIPGDWYSDWQLADQLLQIGEAEIVSKYVEHQLRAHERWVADFDENKPNATGLLSAGGKERREKCTNLRKWLEQIQNGRIPRLM